ncbi:peptidoglycan recognition protein family protein [Streptomyces sp. TP-A0874]|uniref:peptidoglycan recognition protein family protein n=1 Tax=Streptomyces sp. TP-A0874 TaxID=549819 RepID=UPI000852BE88|nr:peptidoglycan recognition protein [Streptomyces sp. TP-A0874]
MRAFLTLSVAVAGSAALVLPASSAATAAPPAPAASPAGATRSLPLGPLEQSADRAGAAVRGLPARQVQPFSLLGVVWKDPDTEFHGKVQVRTRSAATGEWSGWRELTSHSDDRPDSESAEQRDGRTRGGTAPLWVGRSDGVEVRAVPETSAHRTAAAALPSGLRLQLVDPGETTGTTPEAAAASAVNARLAPLGATEIEPLDRQATEAMSRRDIKAAAKSHIGPRPGIVTRSGWGADERLREREFLYTRTVRAAFVHHSATGNDYACKEAPEVLRSIYRYHVQSLGWRDFGYNFAIDKCGTIYEGRAGGVIEPVMGAHTAGFNDDTMGIAVLGTFTSSEPTKAAVEAVSKLTAWKLGLFGANPSGDVNLVSGGGNKFPKGTSVKMKVISGHRDGFATECPGARLYSKLGEIRKLASKLQGR